MKVTITADDFGWSDDTVRATVRCLDARIVTNASIMPGVPCTADAIGFAASHSGYCYGVHIALAGDGYERPVSNPKEIPDLVDRTGHFLPARVIRKRALLNGIPRMQIEREVHSQLDLVAQRGVRISYVDSHKHIHKIPAIGRILSDVLRSFGIDRMRRAQNIFLGRAWNRPTFWLEWLASRQIARSFRTTDLFYMPTHSGDDDWGEHLLTMAGDQTLEVGMHPGLDDEWRRSEMRAVSRFAEGAQDKHIIVPWESIAP